MLLVETTVDRITGILTGDCPVAFVPVDGRDRAKEIATAARDGGFGVSVIEDRLRGWLILVVSDQNRQTNLRRFVGRFGAKIAMDRHVDAVRVYCPSGWLTGMAHSQGADVGRTL